MFEKYHKIQSIYKRDDSGSFILNEFSRPEFEYLFDCEWIGTEKIDGTNIRIHRYEDGTIEYAGRTDKAQIPEFLKERLDELIANTNFDVIFDGSSFTLFGEGFGNRIQKVGQKYIADGVDFILFDVRIGDWWMKRDDVNTLAEKLGWKSVPVIFKGTLRDALTLVRGGFYSGVGSLQAEGLVLTPAVDLFARNGNRIITKIKTKDFK